MCRYMKTSVEIPDALLKAARKRAADEGTTVRALIEEGLRRVLAERERSSAFRLRDAGFEGHGLQPGIGDSWEQIRGLAYEGRGS